MELVRDILLSIERNDDLNGTGWYQFNEPGELGVSECSYERFAYTMKLLADAGFLQAKDDMRMPLVAGLTWEGHEFLDTVRDPEIWRKTKERAKGVASVGIGFLWEIAKAETRLKLGLP
ncbi:DUF2513 domain-containing protein [Komagataeibacter rhaeticus]|nr:DUF2513 domain-containing protein [Komagataeibacter rhaeticus]QOC46423.1 DUF2513 domain-containing protein [Komagataeibacter rhaeticus]QOC46473.1 DUF2513 domain-containing protein [Komagataeibacter rhaeticus]